MKGKETHQDLNCEREDDDRGLAVATSAKLPRTLGVAGVFFFAGGSSEDIMYRQSWAVLEGVRGCGAQLP
jgi:hypothetical protein